MDVRRLGGAVFRSSVAWSMLVILLRVLGFIVVMGVALRLLPRESIGLWYGMVSLTVVAGCVDFGFSATITRVTGYYWAGAASVPELGLSGLQTSTAGPNVGALDGIIAEARRLYRVLSAIYLGVSIALACGWLWMLPSGERLLPELLAALTLLILGSAANLLAMFWPAVLQGLQQVRDFNIYTAAGFLAGYSTALAGLWLGGGLVALASGLVVQSLVTRGLARRHVLGWRRAQQRSDLVRTDWRTFWPMTWRSGLAQAAAQLVLPVTPLLVTTFSLKEAASFGLSVQAAVMLETLAASWISVKWPLFSYLRATRQLGAVRRVAGERLVLSMSTFVVCAAVLPLLAPITLSHIGSRTPFVTLLTWSMLALATGLDLFVGVHAALIQTGNRVSYLPAYVFTGLVNVCAAAALARGYGTSGVLVSVIVSPLLINVWWLPREAWRQLREPATKACTVP